MANVKVTEGRPSSQRYSAALRALKARHPEDFEALLALEYSQDGLEYKRRLSAEERATLAEQDKRAKAQAKVAALIAEFGPDVVPEQMLLPGA